MKSSSIEPEPQKTDARAPLSLGRQQWLALWANPATSSQALRGGRSRAARMQWRGQLRPNVRDFAGHGMAREAAGWCVSTLQACVGCWNSDGWCLKVDSEASQLKTWLKRFTSARAWLHFGNGGRDRSVQMSAATSLIWIRVFARRLGASWGRNMAQQNSHFKNIRVASCWVGRTLFCTVMDDGSVLSWICAVNSLHS